MSDSNIIIEKVTVDPVTQKITGLNISTPVSETLTINGAEKGSTEIDISTLSASLSSETLTAGTYDITLLQVEGSTATELGTIELVISDPNARP